MKAVVWPGKGDVRVDQVNDPEILDPRDIIIQVTASGICGSDHHLFDRMMPTMEERDEPCTGRAFRILGHHASCPRPDAIRHSGDRIAPRLIDSESLS